MNDVKQMLVVTLDETLICLGHKANTIRCD